MISVQDLTKHYAGVQALRGVSLEVRAGEIHALCGENGAGKSTLIKCLAGVVIPDAGAIEVGGHALPSGSVHASEAAGIAVIHQESTVFPDLDTVDNLFVGRELRRARFFLDRPAMRARARETLARLGQEEIDLARPVGELPPAQRQMVAIARALLLQCRALVLDEPTASLSARETAILKDIARRLRADGLALLYVSHRLEEIFELADRVTILRDGARVATRAAADLTRDEVVSLMVGREAVDASDPEGERPREPRMRVCPPCAAREAARPPDVSRAPMEGDGPRSRTANVLPRGASTDANAAPPPLLSVRGLTRSGVLHDVSFEVRAGEILGFGGLVGAGRSEVARCIVGLERRDAGTVAVAGRALPPARMDLAVAAGLALVPEDRQHEGLVLPMRVSENLSMAVLRRLTRWGLIRPAAERALARRHIEALGIRAASPAVPVETLSGGNQQKVAIAKWLATEPRVLILDEPTRGVDVGAKAEVHRLIRQLAAAGSAILLISSDGPELLALSDRIVVLRGGRVAGELGRAEATEEAVLHLALPDAGEAAARA